jgi:hypothetical protein
MNWRLFLGATAQSYPFVCLCVFGFRANARIVVIFGFAFGFRFRRFFAEDLDKHDWSKRGFLEVWP